MRIHGSLANDPFNSIIFAIDFHLVLVSGISRPCLIPGGYSTIWKSMARCSNFLFGPSLANPRWSFASSCPGCPVCWMLCFFPAYSLHFEEMEWPLIRAGMAVTIGFVSRVLVQQMILRAGYWLAVPLCMIHLTFAILALIFTTSEWAVFAQIVCVFGIDPTCAIEGIASWFRWTWFE